MLTRFERARIVGARALQISMGAPVLVKVDKKLTAPREIVAKELDNGLLPLTIVRKMPNGRRILVDIKGETIG